MIVVNLQPESDVCLGRLVVGTQDFEGRISRVDGVSILTERQQSHEEQDYRPCSSELSPA